MIKNQISPTLKFFINKFWKCFRIFGFFIFQIFITQFEQFVKLWFFSWSNVPIVGFWILYFWIYSDRTVCRHSGPLIPGRIRARSKRSLWFVQYPVKPFTSWNRKMDLFKCQLSVVKTSPEVQIINFSFANISW